MAAKSEKLGEIVSQDASLSTLKSLLTAVGLDIDKVAESGKNGKLTVFAPLNEAFTAIAPEIIEKVAGDTALLTKTLEYHVAGQEYDAASIPTTATKVDTLLTVGGEAKTVTVQKAADGVTVNDAGVVTADVKASNGVAHTIDYVLIPQIEEFSTTLVELGASTVGARVVSELLVLANLTAPLSDPTTKLTLFLPTNEAILGEFTPAQLRFLVQKENRAILTKILTFHVVGALAKAADLSNGEEVPTLEGDKLTVKIASGAVSVETGNKKYPSASVTAPDFALTKSGNAVVHLINKLLVPPGIDLGDAFKKM